MSTETEELKRVRTGESKSGHGQAREKVSKDRLEKSEPVLQERE